MEIILKDLKFNNMFSYGSGNTLTLNHSKVTQLTAPNGSGKSTIALIIQELLFGKNIKSIKKGDILNRYLSTSKTWDGSLTFSADNKEYVITSKRTGATTKVSLEEDGIDISEHKVLDTYKKIANILGISFEVFSQLTYQSSTDLLDFIKATDTNRKKFLIKLFGLEKYISIGDAIKIKVVETEKSLIKTEGELKSVNDFLNNVSIEDKQELIEIPIVDQNLITKLGKIQAELSEYNNLCKRIDKNNLLIEERDKLNFDISLKLPDYNSFSKITKIVEDLDADMKHTDRQLTATKKKLENIDLSDTCYACGQPIDNTHAVTLKTSLNTSIMELETKIQELNDVYADALLGKLEEEKTIKEYERNQETIKRFEQLSQLIDSSIPLKYPDYNELTLEGQKVKDNLNNAEEKRDKAVEYNEQVKLHNNRIDTLTEQKAEFIDRQNVLNDAIMSVKSKVKNLDILKKAFSTSGIVAFKLENLAKELEDTINNYLAEFSDGQFQLIFRLSGEKLNIIVFDHGKETPIENVSGGEFSRIQTSILLAIRSLLTKIGGNYINLLFLDEITGVLDDIGKEKLVEVLQKEDNLNVFLISHDFTHPLIDKISINKENNISTVEG